MHAIRLTQTMHIYTFMTHTSRARPSVVDTRMRSLRIDMQVSRMDRGVADTKARPLYLERLYCVVSRTSLFVSMEARTIRGRQRRFLWDQAMPICLRMFTKTYLVNVLRIRIRRTHHNRSHSQNCD